MLEFYEPRLDFSVPEHQSIMGVILSLRDPVDGTILRWAVEEMRVRIPYFYVKAAYRGDDLVTVPNDLCMTVRNTWEPICLHSEVSNYHLAAWKYEGRRLAFEIHHALTDASGVLPYVKSTMFLYLSKATGQTFDPAGFRLPGDMIPESETGNPFSELDIGSVEAPLYKKKPIPDFFRLSDGVDSRKTVFYVKLSERQVMQYCREYDGSPNVLISVLLAKAARRWNPESEKTITVSVCIGPRTADAAGSTGEFTLGNQEDEADAGISIPGYRAGKYLHILCKQQNLRAAGPLYRRAVYRDFPVEDYRYSL